MPTKITSDLEGVSKLLESKRPVGGCGYCLCARDKKILLVESPRAPIGMTLLVPLTALDINRGPTPLVWGVIDARIRNLKERGIL